MSNNKSNVKELIDRKNQKLRAAYTAMNEIWDIAIMLQESDLRGRSFDTLINVTAERLRSLTCGMDYYLKESNIALPEAEQEGTIDNDEPVTEDDLPFDGKEEKE